MYRKKLHISMILGQMGISQSSVEMKSSVEIFQQVRMGGLRVGECKQLCL